MIASSQRKRILHVLLAYDPVTMELHDHFARQLTTPCNNVTSLLCHDFTTKSIQEFSTGQPSKHRMCDCPFNSHN